MKSKKLIIVIIIALVVIILGIGVFSCIYLTTDLLKTNKQLFAKYAGESINTFENFINVDSIKSYYERKTNGIYENESSLVVANQEENLLDVNNADLTIKGAVDNINNNMMQRISVNYSKDNSLDFDFIKNNSNYGVGSSEIVNKYLTLNPSELQEVFSKLEINFQYTDFLENEADLKALSKIDIKALKEKYYNLIKNQLSESDFSKDESAQTAYILTINSEKLKSILNTILPEIKNESIIIENLKASEKNKYQEIIDGYIQRINSGYIDNVSLKIKAYTSMKEIQNLGIEINSNNNDYSIVISHSNSNDIRISLKGKINQAQSLYTEENTDAQEMVITINKGTNADLSYLIETSINNNAFGASIELNGINTNIANEKYRLTINSDDEKYYLQYNNNVYFKDAVQVTNFDTTNSVNINAYSKEQLQTIMQQIIEQIQKVNEEKVSKMMIAMQNGEHIGFIGNLLAMQMQLINEDENMQNLAIGTYNAQFESYVGTNISGTITKALIDLIIEHNSISDEMMQININGYITKENLEALKEIIVADGVYGIAVEYNELGYINKIIITQ